MHPKPAYPNPGSVPENSTVCQRTPSATPAAPFVLDTRPIFARGETPCAEIDQTLAQLSREQTLVLLVPFEPVPLYTKFSRQGFLHRSKQLEDGTWRIEFIPNKQVAI